MKKSIQKGFTLIELIIVIIILGILATLILSNFFTSLKKGRDSKRKADLSQIQRALEMYYEDNKRYPPSLVNNERKLCHPNGCTVKVYMYKVPVDPKTQEEYYYVTDSGGTYYKLYAYIENPMDQGEGVKQEGYAGTTCFGENLCKYMVSSSNIPPAEAIPISPIKLPTDLPQ